MKMSELIAAIGDENIQFQNLDGCVTYVKYDRRAGTQVTFGTEQMPTLEGDLPKLGLIIWFDRDQVKRVMAK